MAFYCSISATVLSPYTPPGWPTAGHHTDGVCVCVNFWQPSKCPVFVPLTSRSISHLLIKLGRGQQTSYENTSIVIGPRPESDTGSVTDAYTRLPSSCSVNPAGETNINVQQERRGVHSNATVTDADIIPAEAVRVWTHSRFQSGSEGSRQRHGGRRFYSGSPHITCQQVLMKTPNSTSSAYQRLTRWLMNAQLSICVLT